MIASLPVTAVLFTAVCNADGCPSFDPAVLWRSVAAAVAPHNLFQPAAFVVVLAWFLFQALLHMAIPGPVVKGTVLPDGSAPLPYCVNGFRCLVVSLYAVVALHVNDVLPLVWVADHALQLAVATAVYSTVLSVYLYWSSFRGNRLLADGGNTGYAVYDFFMGRELNPRWGSFDWKFFCELRPGLIGWTVLNFAYAAKQAAVAGSVSAPMLLVCAFQLYYVIDALWNEAAILTTMDITTDGFGYMLVFGDLVWVPFTYGLQARYLVRGCHVVDGVPSLAHLFCLLLFAVCCLLLCSRRPPPCPRPPCQVPLWPLFSPCTPLGCGFSGAPTLKRTHSAPTRHHRRCST